MLLVFLELSLASVGLVDLIINKTFQLLKIIKSIGLSNQFSDSRSIKYSSRCDLNLSQPTLNMMSYTSSN